MRALSFFPPALAEVSLLFVSRAESGSHCYFHSITGQNVYLLSKSAQSPNERNSFAPGECFAELDTVSVS